MAAARMGVSTALITLNLDFIAQMSCNPAIGGIAKGHLVREIDALGGIMGEVADNTGIQFRLLNSSRGPAVQVPQGRVEKRIAEQMQGADFSHLVDARHVALEELARHRRNSRRTGLFALRTLD